MQLDYSSQNWDIDLETSQSTIYVDCVGTAKVKKKKLAGHFKGQMFKFKRQSHSVDLSKTIDIIMLGTFNIIIVALKINSYKEQKNCPLWLFI